MTCAPRLELAAYSPALGLDSELADVAYGCTAGFADQRPVTPGLVRSRLAAHGNAAPTLLATVRTPGGGLSAAAALRHPAAPGGIGRLWGPVVRPGHQRAGLGRRLLHALAEHVHAAGGPVTTTDLPHDRPAAHHFFHALGWQPTPHAVTLLRATLPLTARLGPKPATVRAAHQGAGDLTRIDALYAAACPGDPHAAGAGARWAADGRFRASCLAVADDGDRLLAAALVYPLAHTHPEREPTEALLGDLLLHPGADPKHALHAARWALTAAASSACAVTARALAPSGDAVTHELLRQLGFTPRSDTTTFTPPLRQRAA